MSPRPPQPAGPGGAASWYALVGPPIAWSAQELTSTLLTIEACASGHPARARWLLVAVTAVALGVTTSAGLLGYRRWRRVSGAGKLVNDEGRERRDMLALMSVVLSTILTLAVLWSGLPALLVSDLCGVGR